MTDGNTEGTFDNRSEDAVETTRQRLIRTTKAYLLGAIHDATIRKSTYRLSQKYKTYPLFVKKLMGKSGYNAWIYREGINREVWIVEFSKSVLSDFTLESLEDKKYYTRGYFDAEGGIRKDINKRFYIYFAQKNRKDLEKVREYLIETNIACGAIHNPSRLVDPDYWRFFVSAKSYSDFARIIGSWHPEKGRLLRMKI